jgi:hypothetical protein
MENVMGDLKLIPVIGQVWTSYHTGLRIKVTYYGEEMVRAIQGRNRISLSVDHLRANYILTKLAPSQLS